MSELSFLEKIFSITNTETTKQLSIFGYTISIDRKYLFKLKYMTKHLDNKKITFLNFNGHAYGCNPKYIAEEIILYNKANKKFCQGLANRRKKEKKLFLGQI